MIPITHDQRIAKFVTTYISIPAGLGIRLADYGVDPLGGLWSDIDEILTEARDVLASGEEEYAGTFNMSLRAEYLYRQITNRIRADIQAWRRVHPREISDVRKSTDDLDWLYMDIWDELGSIGDYATDLRDYLECNREFRRSVLNMESKLADGTCEESGGRWLELTAEDYMANDADACRYRWCMHEMLNRLQQIVVDPRYAFSAGEMMWRMDEIAVLHRSKEDASANNLIAYAHKNISAWESLIATRKDDLPHVHDNVIRMMVSDKLDPRNAEA